MLKDSAYFSFLKQNQVYIVPHQRGMDLIKADEAEVALDLDVIIDEQIIGEPKFLKSLKKTQQSYVLKEKAKSEGKEELKRKSSLYVDDACMYEQIKKSTGCAFLKYERNTGHITEEESFLSAEGPVFPIDDAEVINGHIKLPTNIGEYFNETRLIQDIEAHIVKYLDVPEDYLRYAVLNVLKSWAYERFNSLNYLRVQGEPGTGKSRFLDVIGGLHYKPIATSGAATVAPVFRLINKWGCTLVMDEADLNRSDESNDMIKIINQGFEKDRPVIRCNPDNKSQVEFFNVYCPKVLSTRRPFEDIATESRCMTQIMTGSSRTNIVASLNDTFREEQQMLRNKLLLWRFRNYWKIDPNIGESLDWSGIELRLKQVNVAFAALIYEDKEYVAKFMERIKTKQNDLINERSETVEGHIINACSRLLLEDKPFTAQRIIQYADLTDKHGRLWKPRSISSIMKTLGFLGTKVQRVDDKAEKVYQYNDASILVLFRKYLTEDEFSHFDKDVKSKNNGILYDFHGSYLRYHVTIVTDVYERGKKDKSSDLRTIPGFALADIVSGNNGNIVTNPTDLQKLAGDVFEEKPGVWRMTK